MDKLQTIFVTILLTIIALTKAYPCNSNECLFQRSNCDVGCICSYDYTCITSCCHNNSCSFNYECLSDGDKAELYGWAIALIVIGVIFVVCIFILILACCCGICEFILCCCRKSVRERRVRYRVRQVGYQEISPAYPQQYQGNYEAQQQQFYQQGYSVPQGQFNQYQQQPGFYQQQ